MTDTDRVVVIGAGPYGLSVAAHLGAQGTPYVIHGDAMESWRRYMPVGMFLKSPWGVASSLSHPAGRYTLDDYMSTRGGRPAGPIPVDLFIEYCLWFQKQAVAEVDPARVLSLDIEDGGAYRLSMSDGSEVIAKRVVVASGVRSFAHIPDFAAELPRELCSHSVEHHDLSVFSGKRVAVLGAGQSGLETAALLHELGAETELIVRASTISWIHHRFWNRGIFKKTLYAPSDVGPLGLSWLIAKPHMYSHVPLAQRRKLDRRAIHPAGAYWLRERVENIVPKSLGTAIVEARPSGGVLRLQLSDGSARVVDHLILATGFRPQLRAVSFLSAEVHARIDAREGTPKLNPYFECSLPGLHFAGALATGTYGSLFRFVAGAPVPARAVARAAAARRIQ